MSLVLQYSCLADGIIDVIIDGLTFKICTFTWAKYYQNDSVWSRFIIFGKAS